MARIKKMLFNNIEEIDDKEYNYKNYFTIIVDKNIQKYGAKDKAIFEMDSAITSLQVENKVLREYLNWEE